MVKESYKESAARRCSLGSDEEEEEKGGDSPVNAMSIPETEESKAKSKTTEQAKSAQPVVSSTLPTFSKAKKTKKSQIEYPENPAVVAKTTKKPSFSDVISHQSTKGYWLSNTQPVFAGCYKGG